LACCQRHDLIAAAVELWIGAHQQRSGLHLRNRRECGVDLAFVAGLGCVETRRRGEPIEWIFLSTAKFRRENSYAPSISIDLRKTILSDSAQTGFSHRVGQSRRAADFSMSACAPTPDILGKALLHY
jgi:hypothetical protein